MRILVVDDDEDIRFTVSLAFERFCDSARVAIAVDGAQTIQTLENQIPDLIVLDLGLPDTNGLELCRHILERYVVPVVILTVSDHDEQVIAALESGADDFLTKPFDARVLVSRSQAVTRRYLPYLWTAPEPRGNAQARILHEAG